MPPRKRGIRFDVTSSSGSCWSDDNPSNGKNRSSEEAIYKMRESGTRQSMSVSGVNSTYRSDEDDSKSDIIIDEWRNAVISKEDSRRESSFSQSRSSTMPQIIPRGDTIASDSWSRKWLKGDHKSSSSTSLAPLSPVSRLVSRASHTRANDPFQWPMAPQTYYQTQNVKTFRPEVAELFNMSFGSVSPRGSLLEKNCKICRKTRK